MREVRAHHRKEKTEKAEGEKKRDKLGIIKLIELSAFTF